MKAPLITESSSQIREKRLPIVWKSINPLLLVVVATAVLGFVIALLDSSSSLSPWTTVVGSLVFIFSLILIWYTVKNGTYPLLFAVAILAFTFLFPELQVPAFGTVNPGTIPVILWFLITIFDKNRPVKKFQFTPVHILVIFILAVSIVSPFLLQNTFSYSSILRAFQWSVNLVAGTYLWAQLFTNPKLSKIFWKYYNWFVFFVWLTAIWSFENETYVALNPVKSYVRAIGFSDSANGLAGTLLFILIITIFISKGRWQLINAIGCTIAIFLTGSRTAFLDMLLSTSLIFVVFLFLKSKRYLVIGTSVIVIFMVFIFSLTWISPEAFVQFSSLQERLQGSVLSVFGQSNVGFLDDRSWLWDLGIKLWTEWPLWTKFLGIGFHQSWLLNSTIYDPVGFSFHNLYLTILLEFGLIGLFLFTMVFIHYWIKLRKSFLLNPQNRNLATAVGIATFSLLVMNTTEVFLYGVQFVILLSFTFGILDSLIYKSKFKNHG